MTSVVVDASVVAKWYFPEVHSKEAERWLPCVPLASSSTADARTARRPVVHAPESLLVEIGNVIWKRARRKEITPAEGREMFSILEITGIRLCPDRLLAAVAVDLAVVTGCIVYDCLYLALALSRKIPLVTADRRFLVAVGATPYRDSVIWVETELSDGTRRPGR